MSDTREPYTPPAEPRLVSVVALAENAPAGYGIDLGVYSSFAP